MNTMTVYDKGAFCKRCGHEYDSAAGCKCDPYYLDTAAQVRSAVYAMLLLAVIIGLAVAFCLSAHGAGPDVQHYSANWNR